MQRLWPPQARIWSALFLLHRRSTKTITPSPLPATLVCFPSHEFLQSYTRFATLRWLLFSQSFLWSIHALALYS